jgi:hypothetical protein
VSSLFYVLHVFLGYLLMLIAMTYQVSLWSTAQACPAFSSTAVVAPRAVASRAIPEGQLRTSNRAI